MAKNENSLTNSSDETGIRSLFSPDNVYAIPFFQRGYQWKENQLKQFEKDLMDLIDDNSTSHFLGAVIMSQKQTSPSDPGYYEVIDGQQRITTCYLALLALAKIFNEKLQVQTAIGLYQKYITIGRSTPNITNAKLISSKFDRQGINEVFDTVLNSNEHFKNNINSTEYKYIEMKTDGNEKKYSSRVYKNFAQICKFLEEKFNEAEKEHIGEGVNRLNEIYAKLVDNMSVVQIIVKNPLDGPKIFNSLNSKQQKVTTGDLVRNEIFSESTTDDKEMEALYEKDWLPFYKKFQYTDNSQVNDNAFEKYFFPYVLIKDDNIKNKDAFTFLKENWAKEKKGPKEIIEELKVYQDVYLDLFFGTYFESNVSQNLHRVIHRFNLSKTPSSIYPFIMKAVISVKNGVLDEENAIKIFDIIESFLVRRAICGYEPTGLHAAFKSLWKDCNSVYTPDKVVEVLRAHKTVTWPYDEEFIDSLNNRPLYTTKILTYVLSEWNKSLGGDVPLIDEIQVEHILPQTPSNGSQWYVDWTEEEIKDKKDCIGNLLPLSSALNKDVSNKDYILKRSKYLEDSALKAPREFANSYTTWTPRDFELRSKKIIDWALKRWPY